MAAKYYIYRNLNRGGFSIKHKGLVVDRVKSFEALNVEFRVSDASQSRARRQKSRNVHAYIVCEEYNNGDAVRDWEILKADKVHYNPFYTDTFINHTTQKPLYTAPRVFAFNNTAYIPK